MDDRQRLAISQFVSDRTPRPLLAPVLAFNLQKEIGILRGEVEYLKGHNGRTLIKHDSLRVVLVALKAGAVINEHEGEHAMAFQPLSGHLRLHLPNEVLDLRAQQLVSIDRDLRYSIEAVEDSEFLIWLGWSAAEAFKGV